MKMVNFALSVVAAMLLLMSFFTFGPLVESKFFPVYSKFRIIEAEDSPQGARAIFEFNKYRNCDPQGFAFYNGELGQAFHHVMVNVENTSPGSRLRPLGPQLTSVYNLRNVTVDDLKSSVFAEIYSRCHPLWITRTKIYP